MNPTFRSPNSPGRQAPAPRYPRPPSDDEEEDDSDEDELVRPGSSGSDASSNVTTVSAAPVTPINTQQPGGYFPPQPRSATSPHHPMPNPSGRRPSGRGPSVELPRHRSRHHSQGFFEPSLPTASSDQVPTVSASRIAAQAAMQQTKKQQNVTTPVEDGSRPRRSGSSSPPLMPAPLRVNQPSPQPPPPSGNVATTAANVVFPRAGAAPAEQQPEKQKKKKLFSKPKHIGISSHKDLGKDRGLPSPSKISGLSRMVSGSTTNLADLSSNNSSMYNLSNASVSTVVPADRPPIQEKEKEKDKDKHKHHFLSRQKLKLKDRVEDHFNLPLSSASSNSRPADPNAPQSLYSFTPASPAPGATFGKSVSGLDLLHGGRALRRKRRRRRLLSRSRWNGWPIMLGGQRHPVASQVRPQSVVRGHSPSLCSGRPCKGLG